MSVVNFKSQICTSSEQSEKLLALGLKKETADMFWWDNGYGSCAVISRPAAEEDGEYGKVIPAWSLHRLIEMMPNKTGDYELNINAGKVGYYSCVGWGVSFDLFEKEGEVFNCLIDCIEWLIKEGYFNKEYLV